MTTNTSKLPTLSPDTVATIEAIGGAVRALDPIGLSVSGIDLSAEDGLPAEAVAVLEREMAIRGFAVFKNDAAVDPEDFLRASCWWGGRELHSTHGVHPQTPGGNRHIFRLSNDERHGIPDVGPQWHNDGSFLPATFSHSGYHIVRPAEHGGGTHFAHQGLAFSALPPDLRERWGRLSSVNSASGTVHPVVHRHPITGDPCIWLHLGMTGAVIEKLPDRDDFRLLEEAELNRLCRDYNDVLNAGLTDGYAIEYEYEENDCLFIDNLAVAHRAAPEAHRPADRQGLRIMHRSTVKGVQPLAPSFGLPQQLNIGAPNPLGQGVWQGGGIGFRWQEGIPMRN